MDNVRCVSEGKIDVRGASIVPKSSSQVSRVILGRHVSSEGNLHDVNERHVRLGWLFKNFRSDPSKGKATESESSLKVHPSSRVGDFGNKRPRYNLRRDDMFRRASSSDGCS
jgi:hypothetical protein